MKNAPRLALFLPRLSRYGGVEGFAWRLAEAYALAGIRVDFVCARQEVAPPAGVSVVKVARPGLTRADKVLWYALGADRVMRRGGYDLTVSLAKTFRADILRLSGGPLSVFWELSARAWPAGWQRSWKGLRRRLAPSNRLIRYIEERQLRESGTLVAVSHKVADWLRQAYPWLRERPIEIVYNKPDLARFSPGSGSERAEARQRLGIAPGTVAVGTAGTNFPLKGVGPLVEAMALLPPDHVLLVAGGRNPGRFQRRARDLGLGERVRFLGKVEDMQSFYRALDLFILPSFYDTCSNAVLEAMACGCPTVSSADNGSSFFLPPDQVVADPGIPEDLAAAMRRTLAAPAPGAFAWPADVASGVEPYVSLALRHLGFKEGM